MCKGLENYFSFTPRDLNDIQSIIKKKLSKIIE